VHPVEVVELVLVAGIGFGQLQAGDADRAPAGTDIGPEVGGDDAGDAGDLAVVLQELAAGFDADAGDLEELAGGVRVLQGVDGVVDGLGRRAAEIIGGREQGLVGRTADCGVGGAGVGADLILTI